MTEDKTNHAYKKFIFVLAGILMLLLGITLVLVWWKDVVTIFRGIVGATIAIAGLVVLYFLGKK